MLICSYIMYVSEFVSKGSWMATYQNYFLLHYTAVYTFTLKTEHTVNQVKNYCVEG